MGARSEEGAQEAQPVSVHDLRRKPVQWSEETPGRLAYSAGDGAAHVLLIQL